MIVTLLTDYGTDDEFAGVCRGVIAGIAPDVRVIDLTHGVPRFDVRRGALMLRDSLPYLPVGVHVAVVDPQVGTERRAVAVQCADGRVLVGPDNGLLSLAWQSAGGAELAVDVTRSPHRLEPVSATFHGRDLFAPVAAHVAAGAPVADAGTPLDVDELAAIELPRPRTDGDGLVAHVLYLDGFGNAALNVGHDELAGTGLTLGAAIEVTVAGRAHEATFSTTFADVEPGRAIVYEDAQRHLAVAVNRGDAASALGLAPDVEVRLRAR
jgi:S-adenosylmethionine hydrolase